MDIYQERIRPLFDGASETNAEIERKLGIPPKTINKWNTTPLKSYRNYIPQIASYFQVSADYLLGNTDDPSPPGAEGKPTPVAESGLPPLDKRLNELLSVSSDETKRLMIDLLEKMQKR